MWKYLNMLQVSKNIEICSGFSFFIQIIIIQIRMNDVCFLTISYSVLASKESPTRSCEYIFQKNDLNRGFFPRARRMKNSTRVASWFTATRRNYSCTRTADKRFTRETHREGHRKLVQHGNKPVEEQRGLLEESRWINNAIVFQINSTSPS